MEDMNKTMNRNYFSSVLNILFTIICLPFAWYILYRVDQGLVEVSSTAGIVYKEKFILWLLLTFILGVGIFVAMVQITAAYNDLWEKRSSTPRAF